MSDENTAETQAPETEAQDGVQQETDSRDQLSEMKQQLEEAKRALEETRKAQSGSDKAVQELRKQLEQKEQEATKQKMGAEEKAELALQKLAEAESKALRAERKAQVIDALTKAGVPAPSRLDKLIGETDEETQELVAEHIDYVQTIKQSAAMDDAKRFGRKPVDPSKPQTLTYADMLEMSDEDIKQLPQDVFEKIIHGGG